MVVGQGEVHHRADHDLTIDDDRAILDFVHSQNAGLRRVEDRRGHQGTVNPTVRDGEGATLHFGHAEFAVARPQAQFGDGLFDGGEPHLVGVAHHRNHKAGGGADGHAHMDEVFVNQIGAVDFGVHLGDFGQGVGASFDEERHEAKFDAVLLFKQRFVFVAQVHHGGHVDLVIGGQHGGGVLRVFQAPRDGLAQAGHFDPFFAGGIISGNRRARRGGGCWCWCRSCDRRWCCGVLNVFFHDATVAASAGDLFGVETLFSHQFLGRRGVFDIFCGCWRSSRSLDFCSRGSGGGTFVDRGKQGIDADSGAFGGDDFAKSAGDR